MSNSVFPVPHTLAGFAGALKVKYRDIELGLDLDPEPGLADNGDLELAVRG